MVRSSSRRVPNSHSPSRKRTPLPTAHELIEIVRSRAQRWVNLPNVTSVGVGMEVNRRGQCSGELAIQVTVAQKLDDLDEIDRRGWRALPEVMAVRGRRVPVDILERSYKPAYVLVEPDPDPGAASPSLPKIMRRRRLDPVLPGISISHIRGLAGTLGAVVFDRSTGAPCLLSNFHVLQGAEGSVRDRVLQPGRNDDGNVDVNLIGEVLRSHVGLGGDCAVASIGGRRFDPSILELNVVPRRLARAEIGDVVVKSGRTTGVTRGRVERVGVVVTHDYGGTIGRRQLGTFEIGPGSDRDPTQALSKEGDSGALWMIEEAGTVTDIAVGLHFALDTSVAAGADHALACPIHSVFEKLGVGFSMMRWS
jgi:endonuclease G, mitochondrial